MKLKIFDGGYSLFWCPGCNKSHAVSVNSDRPTRDWKFNNDSENPTLNPSVLFTSKCQGIRCHSFIKDGMIQFLSDCTHGLANQTVPLPDYPK